MDAVDVLSVTKKFCNHFCCKGSSSTNLKQLMLGAPADSINLMELLLNINPVKRPTTGYTLDHSFFKG